MKKVSSNTKKKKIVSGGGKGNGNKKRNMKEEIEEGRQNYLNSLINEQNHINKEFKQFLDPNKINMHDMLNKDPGYFANILYKLETDQKIGYTVKKNIVFNLINIINVTKNRIKRNADDLLEKVSALQHILYNIQFIKLNGGIPLHKNPNYPLVTGNA
jgi:hypothetical protein